jgi:hypothetical protein
MFHRLLGLSGRTYRPLMVNNDPNVLLSQVLWSDVVYVPDFARMARMAPGALLKLAALLHEIYGSFDLCHVVLSAYNRRCGASYSKRYLELLARP